MKNTKKICLASLISLFALNAEAAGSQLFFNNASGLGNLYSGETAIADDASTLYFNPAGLTRICRPQIVAGGVAARFNGQFDGTNIYSIPPVLSIPQRGYTDGAPVYAPYPFAYYSTPLTSRLTFGLGIMTPFGVGVSAPENSLVRYVINQFVSYVIDLSPAIALRVDDQLSAGFGLDIQYMNFLARAKVPSLIGGPDGKSNNRADGWGYGWHAGLLYEFSPFSRAGFTFHSETDFHPKGTSAFELTPGANVGNQIVSNNFHFNTITPSTAAFSIYQDVTAQWALLGTVDFTEWSAIKQTVFGNIAVPSSTGTPAVVNGILNEHYRDSWRFAVGTNYCLDPQWMLRFGVAYETDRTNKIYRTLDNPGDAATSVAVGVHYQFIKTLGFDVGYMHAFIRPSSINVFDGPSRQIGRSQMQRDAAGAQITWNLA